MNRQIERLHAIAGKPVRTVVGLMSGTSLDGLDIAVCRLQGDGLNTVLDVLRFQTVRYDAPFRALVEKVFAKDQIRQSDLSGLHALIAARHADMVNAALASWGIPAKEVDLIASHGQTVYHAPVPEEDPGCFNPFPNSTLQIGDGDHIAVKTGIITVSDFRQKHIAAGGEGAPLALYGDYLLFANAQEDRILLNLGGIANLTYLPSDLARTDGHRPFATDLGPANTLMNQYMQQAFGREMDENGAVASGGNPNEVLLAKLLDDPFFQRTMPRTTGPELFNLDYLKRAQKQSATEDLPAHDVMATLCAFSAESVGTPLNDLLASLPQKAAMAHVYVSGGGGANPTLMGRIRSKAECIISSFEELGVDPNAKEAALFAVLANETVAGNPEHMNALPGVPAVCMGKISLPF